MAPLVLLVTGSELPGLELIRFRYVPAIDDFVAELRFEGHELKLNMNWDRDVVLSAELEMPEQAFARVADQLSTWNTRWFTGVRRQMRLRQFARKYRCPAKASWYEKVADA